MLTLSRVVRRRSAGLAVLLVLAALATAPSPTLAADGQILGSGSDIAGSVYISGSHARVDFSNVGDCPGAYGSNTCWVEIQFRWHCAEIWCFGWGQSSWYRVPAGQDYYVDPGCQDGANQWEVHTRLHYVIPNANTMTIRGDYESSYSGSFLIARYLFDNTINAGFTGGVLINQVYAADYTTGENVIASSPGNIQGPNAC